MIELKPWPADREMMNLLYSESDQSRCLVQIAVPLEETSTAAYLEAVRNGYSNGRKLIAREIVLDGEMIGKIEVTVGEDGEAELDIVIRSQFCTKGYGREAVRMFVQQLRNEQIVFRIAAYVDTGNIPAGRMLASCGFLPARFFRADVLVPYQGKYIVSERRGCEMILEME